MHSNAANTEAFSYAAIFWRGGSFARSMVKILMASLMMFGVVTQARAVVESVSPVTLWCAYFYFNQNPLQAHAPDPCVFQTDLAAAQFSAASYTATLAYYAHIHAANNNTILTVTVMTISSCDGNGTCYYNTTTDGELVQSGIFKGPSLLGRKYPACPDPTTNPEIPYRYNVITRLCERNALDILTLTLSGDTTTEPWHKKRDKEHTRANLPYQAIVRDQNGQPKANVSVTIDTDVTSDSGGHIHINGRPKGKLVAATAGTVSTKDGTDTITGITDGSGVFAFTFGAEEVSGSHTLTANCTDCKAPANSTINVAIQGLMLLDADPLSYTLRGERDEHPGSHYFSPPAIVKIINLAHQYHLNPDFNGELLKINDSSLIKGGTFDVQLDWTSTSNMHGGHRMGIVVDINSFTSEDADFVIFAQKCCGVTAEWHKKGTAPHYHLLLLGEDR